METINGKEFYSRLEVENAILLAADMYKEIYYKSDGWGDTVEKITSFAVQFEKELNWQKDDERDYIEELEKFEDKISNSLRDNIRDFSVKPYIRDLVRCNNCMTKMYVDYDADTCPCCGKEGCLMDIDE